MDVRQKVHIERRVFSIVLKKLKGVLKIFLDRKPVEKLALHEFVFLADFPTVRFDYHT